MKNTTILIMTAIIIVSMGIFVFTSSGKTNGANSITGDAITNSGNIQKITLSTKNYNYYPNTIKVNADQPVEITLDKSVYGCLRAFTINALGVSKYSKSPEEKITFTPTQKGTFTFSCSMGMGYGKLIVE